MPGIKFPNTSTVTVTTPVVENSTPSTRHILDIDQLETEFWGASRLHFLTIMISAPLQTVSTSAKRPKECDISCWVWSLNEQRWGATGGGIRPPRKAGERRE